MIRKWLSKRFTVDQEAFSQGVNLCLNTSILLEKIVQSLQINYNKIEKAMTEDLYVTNEVYELVKKEKVLEKHILKLKKWNKDK